MSLIAVCTEHAKRLR